MFPQNRRNLGKFEQTKSTLDKQK